GDGLERRAGGVEALRGAVEDRTRGVLEHRVPLLLAEVGREHRIAYHREDVAIAGIDRDDGPGIASHRLGRETLEAHVDGEAHVVAGPRLMQEVAERVEWCELVAAHELVRGS